MRRIGIHEAQPGMLVGREVMSDTGEVLLNRGVALTKRYIASLKEKSYSSLVIDDESSYGIDVPELISTEVRTATTTKLKTAFESLRRAVPISDDDDGTPSTEDVVRGLHSKAFTSLAKHVDPYETVVTEIGLMLDDLLTADVLDGLNAIKMHDDFILQHSVDVCVTGLLIGKRMQLESRDPRMLALGCLVHDIGKILIDREIIQKRAALTCGEWVKMQSHAQLGYLMLRSSGSPQDLLAHHVAYQHHARQDGQGYPRGLMGSNSEPRSLQGRYKSGEMLQIAQIAAVANIYEALSSPRPYREAFPHEKIPNIMAEIAGSVLNRRIVEVFLEILPTFPTVPRSRSSEASSRDIARSWRGLTRTICGDRGYD